MRISDWSSDVCSSDLWWRLASAHNRTLAEQYRRLANRIQGQKQLLDSINGAIEEFIGLKAPDGTYRYANPAFAQAVSRSPETMVGLDDAAIFGQGTAKRLALRDRSEVHTSELQSLMRTSYAVSCL